MQKFSDKAKKSSGMSVHEEHRLNKIAGGLVGGRERAKKLSPERRREIARAAGRARAAKFAARHPERSKVRKFTMHALDVRRNRKIPRTVCGNWKKPGSKMRIAAGSEQVDCKYCLLILSRKKELSGKVTSTNVSTISTGASQPVLGELPAGCGQSSHRR